MNGKVICNTGPIVALSMIDRIDILRDLFELVSVPEAVHMEILEGGTTNAGLAGYRFFTKARNIMHGRWRVRRRTVCLTEKPIKVKTMCEEPMKKELAKAMRELFEAKFGEFRIDDLIEVLKEFEITAIKKLPAHLRGDVCEKLFCRHYR